MQGIRIKIVHFVKDLGVTVTSNLKFSQQSYESVKKANRMMSLIKRKFSFKNKDVLPLCNRFVRPYLEYAVQFWSPHHSKSTAKLGIQHRATNMINLLTNPMRKDCHIKTYSLLKNADC